MTSAIPPQPSEATGAEAEAELNRHGIVRRPAEFFEYGGYRYTKLEDALAEARRHPAAGP